MFLKLYCRLCRRLKTCRRPLYKVQSTEANKQLDTPMFVVVRCVNISELRSNQLLRQCQYNIKALLIKSGYLFYDVPGASLDSIIVKI